MVWRSLQAANEVLTMRMKLGNKKKLNELVWIRVRYSDSTKVLSIATQLSEQKVVSYLKKVGLEAKI